MKKLVLKVVLVVAVVGLVLAGVGVADSTAASPTLKITYGGSYAPGTVTIAGAGWTPGTAVNLYLDVADEAHHVAVATAGSSGTGIGTFVRSFSLGPTTLGYHNLFGIQGALVAAVSFTVVATQQLDDRMIDALNNLTMVNLDNVAIVDTYSGNFTFVTNGTFQLRVSPTMNYTEMRHVSLTLLVGQVSMYDSVSDSALVLVYFPSLDAWGYPESIGFSDTEDGYCVKMYEFDTTAWQLNAYVFVAPLILAWNVVTTKPL